MKTIKQTTDWNCVAAVGAMATRTTVEEFEKFIERDPRPDGYTDLEFANYLLAHNYLLGGVGATIHGKDRTRISSENIITVQFCINQFPAYLVVKSERFKDHCHAVYWDGENIRDPSSRVRKLRVPCSYYIYYWFPILSFDKEIGRFVNPIS